jgi:hypothetical protein
MCVILVLKIMDIINNLADLFCPVAGGIPLSMITEFTTPPITAPCGNVRED